jgi:hypothetical protein
MITDSMKDTEDSIEVLIHDIFGDGQTFTKGTFLPSRMMMHRLLTVRF